MNFQKIFFSIIFLSFLNLTSYATSLIVYRDFSQKGDENQAQGIIRAYQDKIKDLTVQEFNIGQEEDLKSYIEKLSKNSEDKSILLSVGEKTVSSFSKLLPLENVTTVHSCHMVTENHKKLIGKINFIALPVHALGDFEQKLKGTKTHLIKTVGVPHNRNISTIDDIYYKNKSKISPSDSYLGLILGGDAPTPDQKTLLFTEDNARELARSVAAVIGTRHLLVINGPRTGKYDPSHPLDASYEEIKTAHRHGNLDFVTQAFVEELRKQGLSQDQFTLFDFQFNSMPNQDMNLLLGAIRATHSYILVSGESTSAISECVDVLNPKSVIVYQNSAMNSIHEAHFQSEIEAERVSLLALGYKDLGVLLDIKESEEQQSEVEKTSAAEKIVLELSKHTL